MHSEAEARFGGNFCVVDQVDNPVSPNLSV